MGDFPLKKAILSLEETVVSPQHTPTAPRTADSGPLIKRYPQSMLQETRPVITCPQNNSLIEMTDWAPPFCCFVYVTPASLAHTFAELIGHICYRNQRRRWHPTPVLLPGKSHGRRSLVGCSPWGLEESDTTEVT